MSVKIFACEFWVGGAGNRSLMKKLRLPAESPDKIREGLVWKAAMPDGSAVPKLLEADAELLVIAREVEPTAQESQGEFNLI
ncbi:MAG: hypothetical protein JWQ04_652 [Pedosphaera sp.]|nr:hypothetical protein [Pedosphaera sp.]